MRSIIKISSVLIIMIIAVACKKTAQSVKEDTTVPQNVLDKIYALGFSKQNVQVHEDGYLVEGDIIITENDLAAMSNNIQLLRVGTEEQYRTTNLVSGLPRTITVSMSSRLPASYSAALDEAFQPAVQRMRLAGGFVARGRIGRRVGGEVGGRTGSHGGGL